MDSPISVSSGAAEENILPTTTSPSTPSSTANTGTVVTAKPVQASSNSGKTSEAAKEEAQRQRAKFEQQRQELEAKLRLAQQQQQALATTKKAVSKERMLEEKKSSPCVTAVKRKVDDTSNDFTIAMTGNRKLDSKAARELAKKQKADLFQAMGIMGFGKEASSSSSSSSSATGGGNSAGARLVPPDWGAMTLPSFQKKFYSAKPSVASVEEAKYLREKLAITVQGSNLSPVSTFEDAGFSEVMLQALEDAGFSQPTPIQAQSWPVILSGQNLIGLAETGSGKTLAYLLPACIHASAQPELRGEDGPIALVLAPTRELTMQIQTQMDRFADCASGPEGVFSLRNACLFGGVDKAPQKRQLQRGAELCVACPGRLLDFLEGGTTNLNRVTYLVLDEADRMLEMGFEPQVRKICELVRPDRQTLLWSATWPRQVRALAEDFVKDPVTVQVGKLNAANSNIKQTIVCTTEDAKKSRLFQLLESISESSVTAGGSFRVLIFCLTKVRCECLYTTLTTPTRANSKVYPVNTLHGDRTQGERDFVMSEFRSGNTPYLIATDVAARGLDIKEVKYVINYDMPLHIEEYVHRIGRTGRGGEEGFAFSFVTPENSSLVRPLLQLLRDANQSVPRELEDMLRGGSSGGSFSYSHSHEGHIGAYPRPSSGSGSWSRR